MKVTNMNYTHQMQTFTLTLITKSQKNIFNIGDLKKLVHSATFTVIRNRYRSPLVKLAHSHNTPVSVKYKFPIPETVQIAFF